MAAGVVFGDIGTSPLYALKECVDPGHGVAATQANVMGLLSLVMWSLTMVVTVKYLMFIMRADNQGEGGILALLALVPRNDKSEAHRVGLIAGLAIFGAALLYGDGVITPAISVLSAVEGLGVATTKLTPIVVPLTVGILVGLFWVQRRGTASIGGVFGPIMLLWFFTLSVLGVVQIVQCPWVLGAIDPMHGVRFFARHGWHGFAVLGRRGPRHHRGRGPLRRHGPSSGERRSATPGSASSCRPSSSTTSGRARGSSGTQAPTPTPSLPSCLRRSSTRWSPSPRWRPSSPRRRSSPVLIR